MPTARCQEGAVRVRCRQRRSATTDHRDQIEQVDRRKLAIVGSFADLSEDAGICEGLECDECLLLARADGGSDGRSRDDRLSREEGDELRRGRVRTRSAGTTQPIPLQARDIIRKVRCVHGGTLAGLREGLDPLAEWG